jgi:hypothetical protein
MIMVAVGPDRDIDGAHLRAVFPDGPIQLDLVWLIDGRLPAVDEDHLPDPIQARQMRSDQHRAVNP